MQISSATLPMCGNNEHISWPGFAELLERMLRAEAGQALALELRDLLPGGEGVRHGLAGHLGELGFVVEGFQMRGAAGLIEEDDALSLGRMMQGVDHARGCQQPPVEQRIQGQQADAG